MENIKINCIRIHVGMGFHITNTYIVYDENKSAVIIDPAGESHKILEFLKENNLNLKAMFLTHCHADHTSALTDILKYIENVNYGVENVKIYIHEKDLENINSDEVCCKTRQNIFMEDIPKNILIPVVDDELINVTSMNFKIIYTPGHTKGSMCIFLQNCNSLFTGDTVFDGVYGRTDLVTGSFCDMEKSLKYLFENFKTAMCFPGHGGSFVLGEVEKKILLLLACKEK